MNFIEELLDKFIIYQIPLIKLSLKQNLMYCESKFNDVSGVCKTEEIKNIYTENIKSSWSIITNDVSYLMIHIFSNSHIIKNLKCYIDDKIITHTVMMHTIITNDAVELFDQNILLFPSENKYIIYILMDNYEDLIKENFDTCNIKITYDEILLTDKCKKKLEQTYYNLLL